MFGNFKFINCLYVVQYVPGVDHYIFSFFFRRITAVFIWRDVGATDKVNKLFGLLLFDCIHY